jgi:transposase
MQKTLTQMNVQLANVISDISGLTGQTIIRTIVAGERSAKTGLGSVIRGFKPAMRRSPKACRTTGVRNCCLYCNREVEMYDTYQKRIIECDQRLQKHLASFTDTHSVQTSNEKPKAKKPAAKKCPALRSQQRTAACHGRGPHPH